MSNCQILSTNKRAHDTNAVTYWEHEGNSYMSPLAGFQNDLPCTVSTFLAHIDSDLLTHPNLYEGFARPGM